jgi:hypothetical protein
MDASGDIERLLGGGADQVRRSDIAAWIDPTSDAALSTFREWQSQGFITILADPRDSRDKAVCLRILKRIDALPMPEDLNDPQT